MRIVPKQPAQLTLFYATRLERWQLNAAAIGLTPEEVAELADRVAQAKAAALARDAAVQAARAATRNYHRKIKQLAGHGAGLMARIRASAQAGGDPGIYPLAWIPAPRKAAPVPAPGVPYQLRVSLETGGVLRLAWKCRNPANAAGTMYQVQRRIDGGAWTLLGTAGRKGWTDTTIPAGAVALEYQVRAVRSTGAGMPAIFPVRLSGSEGWTRPRQAA